MIYRVFLEAPACSEIDCCYHSGEVEVEAANEDEAREKAALVVGPEVAIGCATALVLGTPRWDV